MAKKIHPNKSLICLLIVLYCFQSATIIATEKRSSQIDTERFNEKLLIQEIYRFTNKARETYNLSLFQWSDSLAQTAHDHSLDMASHRFLSHTSPNLKNQTLQKRLENHGYYFTHHTFAENIGVDYFLDIAGKPYYEKLNWPGQKQYINYNTGEIIEQQTYENFAKAMVNKWLKSPGHRKNLLNPQLQQLGVGAVQGEFQDFDAIYVTQVFLGILDIQIRKKEIMPLKPQIQN